VQMLCHGLWNSTPTVVAYNRELLSLNARLADSRIEREDPRVKFSFTDPADQQLIFSGAIHSPRQASIRANLALMSALGFGRGMALARQPWVSLQVLNPLGGMLDRNAVARTFTHNQRNVVRFFDPGSDTLEFGNTPYRSLQFIPQCVQDMDGFKFVYLHPE
jgi:hypothetical protein